MLQVVPVEYCEDPAVLFAKFAHLHGAVWLDSGRPFCTMGRYDILSALPQQLLTPELKPVDLSPFEYVQQAAHSLPDIDSGLPFTIGLLGYFSYECGAASRPKPSVINAPEFTWGIYKQSFVFDHQERRAYFCYWDNNNHNAEELLRCASTTSKPDRTSLPFVIGDFEPFVSWDRYQDNIRSIQNHIVEGDCYQVNYTCAHSSPYSGDTLQAFIHLRHKLPSPFGGFMRFGELSILSFSPEQFIEVTEDAVKTLPIKGTRPRGKSSVEDETLKQALRDSTKDQAENLMIVDLLRNDLGKVALPGTVTVDKLFEIQSFANVHHLVSTVSCKIRANQSSMAVLEAAWPGGSITGAPKKRAMTIIEELETHARGVYCGSIGYLSSNGNLNTNLCIRTIIADDSHMVCWAGGGIVADSIDADEYKEANDKIAALLNGLQEFKRPS